MIFYLLDFEDSYSYNIVADFKLYLGVDLQLIPLIRHSQFIKSFFNESNSRVEDVSSFIIFGPGPYAPNDYPLQRAFLKNYLERSIPILGICLGHQLLCQELGFTITRSRAPKHGLQERINLTPSWQKFFSTKISYLSVQRYNSLAVVIDQKGSVMRNSNQFFVLPNAQGEIMLLRGHRIMSMQYHPESVGTASKEIHFEAIQKFISECHGLA